MIALFWKRISYMNNNRDEAISSRLLFIRKVLHQGHGPSVSPWPRWAGTAEAEMLNV